jgi:glycosyltransferase involved in cell wall biosynthesis
VNEGRKLRVLFITSDTYPPFRPAARAIFGEELVNKGHVVDWILQAEKACLKPMQISVGEGWAYVGATDDGTSRWRRLRKHLLGLKNDLRVFALAKKNSYDVIQIKDKYIGAVLAIIAARLTHTCVLYWLAYPHAEASLYAAEHGVARYRLFYIVRGIFFKLLLYKIIVPSCRHIFVQSEQMKRDVADQGISVDKMTPVPGSVNLDSIPYRPASPQDRALEAMQERRIVYLGTLLRERQLGFIIRVLAKVLDRQPDAKLYMIGKGENPEDEELLHAEAKRLDVTSRVVFTGYLPMAEAWEYIRGADVCVSPYFPTPILNSTSPTKLIEYMAMGKAVVGNDHPEQSLVIAESGGGLCAPWDEQLFAEAITTLLNDPRLTREMGMRGRRYVEAHRTNAVMGDLVAREYYRVCEGR